MIDLSLIICCYNSQDLLKETLTHIANQNIKQGFVYEVVLVDNRSEDNTVHMAKEIWNQLETITSLKIVKESQPGLSYARKTGVLASKGEIIVFCDDDNWLQEDYLQISYDFMVLNTEVGALGGQSQGVLEIDEPNWWQKEKANYAVGKQAEISGNITKRGYVWGAGIVLRKKDILKLYNTGFMSLLSGRKGQNLGSGDDSEICKWILLMGYELWYLETLRFKHYITKKRLTITYLENMANGHRQAQTVLSLYDWFLNSKVYEKENYFTLKGKVFYFRKALKKYLNKNREWRILLQLTFGSSVIIHPDLHQIINTYMRLKS